MADCNGIPAMETYYDFIVEYGNTTADIQQRYGAQCVTRVNSRFAVAYVEKKPGVRFSAEDYAYDAVPRCFGLMDVSVLEETGTANVRRSTLDLYGNGVLVAVIDTGIDYLHPAFIQADGTSKIYSIWDQTIDSGNPPGDFLYGTEYTNDEINQSFNASVEQIPTRDISGHGTFLAGLIAGNELPENGFSGIAPDAQLVVVKLKQAKEYLKEYTCIAPGKEVYAENDIMLGISYATYKARQAKRPMVIFLGLGTNQASHVGAGPLSQYLESLAPYPGIAVIVCGGNEGQANHHFNGSIEGDTVQVELKIGPGEYGCLTELWGYAPNRFYVDVESPSGQRTGIIQGGRRGSRQITFLLEQTQLNVEFFSVDTTAGSPVVVLRFQNPGEGIWLIEVTDDQVGSREFDMWLPVTDFISEDTYFLQPSPYNTLTSPGNAVYLICTSYYNQNNDSIYIDSGRGYPNSGVVKPDFAAPGVQVTGPLPRGRFGQKTGSSVGGALTAGIAALFLEWGIVKGNNYDINTVQIKNYLIRGARRDDGRNYPNREWGYGAVDIYTAFLEIR